MSVCVCAWYHNRIVILPKEHRYIHLQTHIWILFIDVVEATKIEYKFGLLQQALPSLGYRSQALMYVSAWRYIYVYIVSGILH